jgi:hypothetical protein
MREGDGATDFVDFVASLTKGRGMTAEPAKRQSRTLYNPNPTSLGWRNVGRGGGELCPGKVPEHLPILRLLHGSTAKHVPTEYFRAAQLLDHAAKRSTVVAPWIL